MAALLVSPCPFLFDVFVLASIIITFLWSTNHYCSVTTVHCTCSSRYSHDHERSPETANKYEKSTGRSKEFIPQENYCSAVRNEWFASVAVHYLQWRLLNDIARLWLWLFHRYNYSVWLNFNRYDVNNNNVISVRCVPIIMQNNCDYK